MEEKEVRELKAEVGLNVGESDETHLKGMVTLTRVGEERYTLSCKLGTLSLEWEDLAYIYRRGDDYTLGLLDRLL